MNNSPTPTKTFKELELLRFVCAFTIVVWHYQHFFLITDLSGPHIEGWARNKQPFYWLFYVPYNFGGKAVEVFWMISGFIFFWKYADEISSGKIRWLEFFWLRFSRLYPLHLATLLLVAALQMIYYDQNGYYTVYQGIDLYRFVLNLFMASGWGPGFDVFSFNAPIWSVSVEEIVYAVFFVLATLFRQRFWRALLIVLICDYLMKKVQGAGWGNYMFPLMCGKFYFLGGALYRAYAWWKLKPIENLKRLGILPETLGNLTYSSYLLHFPLMIVFMLITDSFGWTREVYYDWRVWFVYMLVTFVMAHLVFRYFEKPAMDYLRRTVRFRQERRSIFR